MDREARQELHQKSLRNVRALLDKEEAEAARAKKTTRKLLLLFIPAGVLVLALLFWGGVGRNTAPDPKLLECQTRIWAEKSGEREREIRAQNPGISPADVGARLQAENASIEAAAARECQANPRR